MACCRHGPLAAAAVVPVLLEPGCPVSSEPSGSGPGVEPVRPVDSALLGEDITGHAVTLMRHPHEDGRLCAWHARLGEFVFDVRPGAPSWACTRDHRGLWSRNLDLDGRRPRFGRSVPVSAVLAQQPRCVGVWGDLRCQLAAGHDGAHRDGRTSFVAAAGGPPPAAYDSAREDCEVVPVFDQGSVRLLEAARALAAGCLVSELAERDRLLERVLASRREDLVAGGVDPSELDVPLHPTVWCTLPAGHGDDHEAPPLEGTGAMTWTGDARVAADWPTLPEWAEQWLLRARADDLGGRPMSEDAPDCDRRCDQHRPEQGSADVEAQIAAVLAQHQHFHHEGGCSCGWKLTMRDFGRWSESHRSHVAAELARLIAEAKAEGAQAVVDAVELWGRCGLAWCDLAAGHDGDHRGSAAAALAGSGDGIALPTSVHNARHDLANALGCEPGELMPPWRDLIGDVRRLRLNRRGQW